MAITLPLAPLLGLLVASASGHAVILNAQGLPNSPASYGFQMINSLPRNCTSINPCQSDATLIRDAEISANVVNECGRTELLGNIDIGENTENALAAQQVTQVKSGSTLTITMHQVNADGAGPFICDMDPTSNGLALTGQIPLPVMGDNIPGTNGLSQEKERDFNLTLQMPPDMKCIGGSTGNICTVRCRNNAQAGPFGGCVAVQQVDTTPNINTPQNIAAFKSLKDVLSQIDHNDKDFPAALQGIQNAGSDASKQAVDVANELTGGLPNANPVKAPAQQVSPQQQQAQFAPEQAQSDAVAQPEEGPQLEQRQQGGNGNGGESSDEQEELVNKAGSRKYRRRTAPRSRFDA